MKKCQEYNAESLEIKVIRGNRRSMTLTVNAKGEVIVRAPYVIDDARVRAFVEKNMQWIDKRLQARKVDFSLNDGAQISLHGKTFTVVTGKRAALSEGSLYLPERNREEAFIRLLKSLTEQRMRMLLDLVCKNYGFSYSSFSVTSARGRWGSCNSKKKICFSFRTAFLPNNLAAYLAVHEICHTLQMNHSAAFWNLVESILPDYKTSIKSLKAYNWASNIL